MSRTYRRKGMSYFNNYGSEAQTFNQEFGEFRTWYLSHGDDYFYSRKPYSYWKNKRVPNEKDFKLFHSDKYKHCGNRFSKWHADANLECHQLIGRNTVRQKLKNSVKEGNVDNFINDDDKVKHYIDWY